MKRVVGIIALGLCTAGAFAKLPPLSDDAKAKAAEAAAKTAHADKVGAYKLCQSMDKVAARLSGRRQEGRQGREAGRHAGLHRSGPVCLHAAIAKAAGSRRRALAPGQGQLAAEHQHPRSCGTGSSQEALNASRARGKLAARQQAS